MKPYRSVSWDGGREESPLFSVEYCVAYVVTAEEDKPDALDEKTLLRRISIAAPFLPFEVQGRAKPALMSSS
jgi:hypothetical protein